MVNLNSSILAGLLVPFPPIQEQRAFAERLTVLEGRLEGEAHQFDKRRTLKLGLLDDLLTGRVRVKVPEEASA